MIDFLIKSSVCLAVFLTFYHLVLELEKTHRFNRFYLLFALLISFIIPFLSFEIVKIIPIQNEETILIPNFENIPTSVIVEKVNYIFIVFCSLYGIITSLIMFRFVKNISKLIHKTKSNTIVNYKKATLVLVKEKTLPHSFLNFIFINSVDYNNQSIEDELYTHELVHVTQKHTLDILLIEFLKCVFWFNPLFYFYKKAIQLNHEFLADEKVVNSHNNVSFYQNLLLQKSSDIQTINLASNLNYLVTKKRLIMMTKNTSEKLALIKKVAVVPILATLIYFFCIEVVAKENVISTTKINGIDWQDIKNNRILEITNPEKLNVLQAKIKAKKNSKKVIDSIKGYKIIPLPIVKINNKNYKKINDYYFNEEGSIDINGKKYLNGYIEINRETYYYTTEADNSINYFNRIGILVDKNGIVITSKKSNLENQDKVYSISEVDEVPEFVGGIMKFYKFIADNFNTSDEMQRIGGKIFVTFVIEKDGSLSDIKINKDFGFGSAEETIRVLKLSPNWKPAKLKEQNVRVFYSFPITISK